MRFYFWHALQETVAQDRDQLRVTLLDRSSPGEDPNDGFKISSAPSGLCKIKIYKYASLRKRDRNCLLFANRCWEMLRKATGQPLGTA
jgi:hypothetical protein